MEYLKINSLWKRQGWYFDEEKKNNTDYQKGRQSFIIGDYAEPAFGNIKKWHVEEKIDGTNIRIFFEKEESGNCLQPKFGGRTKDAQIPCHLLDYLQIYFTTDRLSIPFSSGTNVILFGEGYGPKIQKGGGNYRKDPGFILFDVRIGQWWLERDAVKSIADQLGIPSAPSIGIMTEDEIVTYVKSNPMSLCSDTPQVMEGVICRANPLLLFRDGKPLMWKLKTKEFQ